MDSELEIEQLLCAEAFPHPVQRLELMETHLSWVILTGPFAYKIKKPVKYDFVDYSRVDLRKHYCQEELKLNRRFAPGLYLEVVPISRVDGKLKLDDASEPVAWAVKMREFPQHTILAARLEHDELTVSSVWQFGESLVQVHEDMTAATADSNPLVPELIERQSEENYQFLRGVLPDDWRMNLLRRVHHWSRWEYRYCLPAFRERLNGGRIRKCHGDMHLKNVLQLDGEVMAFDGIEFSAELQWIDVMSELAFPVMDFAARGRPDLGWHLINAYLETGGDYDGVRVLRYYLVYRALVRAKVTWMNPANHVSNIDSSGPWDKYLRAAELFAFGLQPALAITHGFSGSGKSTRALDFIESTGGIRIRSDVERTRSMAERGQGGHNVTNQAAKYSEETSDRVYHQLLELAGVVANSGLPVVVDATFLKFARRRPFLQLATDRDIPFQILGCDAPPAELRQRIQSRYGDASEATIEVLDQQMADHDPLTTAELEFLAPSL
ncbi:MAG: AAA family ATPase [Pirellulaceae bacterium]